MLLKCIPYPDPERAKNDEFAKIREVDCANLARKWPHYDFLNKAKVFLATLTIAQPNNNDHGISWLELAMLYEYRTGTAIPDNLTHRQDPHDLFLKPTPFKRICQNFSTACRRILEAVPGGNRANNSGSRELPRGIDSKALGHSPALPRWDLPCGPRRTNRLSSNSTCSGYTTSKGVTCTPRSGRPVYGMSEDT